MGGAYTAFGRRAYLLIKVEPGMEEDVMEHLQELPNVTSVDFVHGSYDIVCVLEGEFKNLDPTLARARRFPHVVETTTLTVFDTALQ